MSYTPEQLSKMNDVQVECAVHSIFNPDYDPIVNTLIALKYCTDWSITGPLMVKYKVFPRWSEVYGEYVVEFGKIRVRHTNPLRAVCEVILQMKEEI